MALAVHLVEQRGRPPRPARACTSWRRTTTGSSPPVAPAPERVDRAVGHQPRALRVALRGPRHPAALPGDVVGDPDRQAGPLRDRDQRLGQARPALRAVRARPKIRLMQAGQVDGGGALARGRPAAARAPACGMFRGHSGTSSSPSARRAARLAPRIARRRAPRARRPSAARPAPRARPPPSARRAARRSARRARSAARARSPFTSLPVSIPTGQARHAGAVGGAGLERRRTRTRRAAASSTGEPGAWRAISRRSTIRWRGVVVRSRLGHTGSQKPHSTQVVASSSIGGVVFRLRRWTPGSSLSTTPGAEHAVGVGEPLDPPHQLGRLCAPLALDERRHVAPRCRARPSASRRTCRSPARSAPP